MGCFFVTISGEVTWYSCLCARGCGPRKICLRLDFSNVMARQKKWHTSWSFASRPTTARLAFSRNCWCLNSGSLRSPRACIYFSKLNMEWIWYVLQRSMYVFLFVFDSGICQIVPRRRPAPPAIKTGIRTTTLAYQLVAVYPTEYCVGRGKRWKRFWYQITNV